MIDRTVVAQKRKVQCAAVRNIAQSVAVRRRRSVFAVPNGLNRHIVVFIRQKSSRRSPCRSQFDDAHQVLAFPP